MYLSLFNHFNLHCRSVRPTTTTTRFKISIMSGDRDELNALKASRRGYKSSLGRIKNSTLLEINQFQKGQNPIHLETLMKMWRTALEKYVNAEDRVMGHINAEDGDFDKDVAENQVEFSKTEVKVIALREEFDASMNPVREQDEADLNQSTLGRNEASLPRLQVNPPPTLEEDTDLRKFIKWVPLWENYAELMELSKRRRPARVGCLWQCCSPGFLKIIRETLGIKAKTTRDVEEILDMITTHLRSFKGTL